MKEFFDEHGTKLYGGLTTFFGALQGLVTTGAFKELMTPVGIGWLGIVCSLATALLGGMTVARGFNNSTKVRTAEAMAEAINATPGTVVPKL